MKIHFCTKDPCPELDKEIAKKLDNACDTGYTDEDEDTLHVTGHGVSKEKQNCKDREKKHDQVVRIDNPETVETVRNYLNDTKSY